jgi:hypothetical protein
VGIEEFLLPPWLHPKAYGVERGHHKPPIVVINNNAPRERHPQFTSLNFQPRLHKFPIRPSVLPASRHVRFRKRSTPPIDDDIIAEAREHQEARDGHDTSLLS